MKREFLWLNFPLILALLASMALSVLTIEFFVPLETSSFLHNWMRGFMVYFFALFSLLKLVNIKAFIVSFSRYDRLSQKFPVFAYAYPFIEGFLALMYALNIYLCLASAITIFISLEVAWSMILFLQHKEKTTCACMGSGIFQVPLTSLSVLENIIMAAMALWMIY